MNEPENLEEGIERRVDDLKDFLYGHVRHIQDIERLEQEIASRDARICALEQELQNYTDQYTALRSKLDHKEAHDVARSHEFSKKVRNPLSEQVLLTVDRFGKIGSAIGRRGVRHAFGTKPEELAGIDFPTLFSPNTEGYLTKALEDAFDGKRIVDSYLADSFRCPVFVEDETKTKAYALHADIIRKDEGVQIELYEMQLHPVRGDYAFGDVPNSKHEDNGLVRWYSIDSTIE